MTGKLRVDIIYVAASALKSSEVMELASDVSSAVQQPVTMSPSSVKASWTGSSFSNLITRRPETTGFVLVGDQHACWQHRCTATAVCSIPAPAPFSKSFMWQTPSARLTLQRVSEAELRGKARAGSGGAMLSMILL